MTICVHTVIYGAQVSIIFYYYVCEHLDLSLYQKVKRTLIPTALTCITFGIAESIFAGMYWKSAVLTRGIASLTIFWLVIRVVLTLLYTGTFAIGLIPQSYIRLPSTFLSPSTSQSLLQYSNRCIVYHFNRSFGFGCAFPAHAGGADGSDRRSTWLSPLHGCVLVWVHFRDCILSGVLNLCPKRIYMLSVAIPNNGANHPQRHSQRHSSSLSRRFRLCIPIIRS